MTSNSGASAEALQRSYSLAPPVDAAVAEKLLAEAKQILDALGVVFFLRQGTCLGAVRDNSFIPWDDDVDLGSVIGLHGVTENTADEVIAAFTDNGYFVKVERTDQATCVAMMKQSTRIDWVGYRVFGNDTFHYPGLRIPVSCFSSLKEIDFANSKVLVPDPPEEYLRRKYGEQWRTPTQAGFEKAVLDMVPDELGTHASSASQATKLRVLDFDNRPVADAAVRVASVGRVRTDARGYAAFHLPDEDWYALVINYTGHEEVLYQEKMAPGETYTYKADPDNSAGRLCILAGT